MKELKETPWGAIPEQWSVSTIAEQSSVVTDYVANGSFAALAENVKYKSEEDVAVLIRLVDFNNGFKGDFVFIDQQAYEFLGKSKLFGEEIIISNVGANVGTVFKCPKLKYKMSLAPNSIMVKFKGDNDFYYYWFKSKQGQQMLQSIVTGSAQPKFNKTNFKELLVPVPPIDEQKRISRILRSIDDKIELNNRINHNLEEQAQALYRSWFVDFEPFKNEEFAESEMGMIPSSCHIQKLQDLCDVVTKGTTPTSIGFSFTDAGIPFIKVECIREDHVLEGSKCAFIDSETHSALLRSQIRPRDILFTIAGTLGRFCLMPDYIKEANTNQAVCIIRVNPNAIPVDYLYSLFLGRYHVDYCSKNVQQAVQANLSLGTLKNLPILIPGQEKLKEYTESIRPIISAMELRKEETRQLINCRDSLLPRLMNGSLTC